MTAFREIAMPMAEAPPDGRRPSAVLVALMDDGDRVQVILTERSAQLRHHAGQISFPGGRIDDGESAIDAALREAHEEIGLKPEDVEVLGHLPGVVTTANFHIAPVVGVVRRQVELTPAPDEVARILIEDIQPLLDRSQFEREPKQYNGVDYQTWVIRHPREYIWGATAKLLVQCASLYHHAIEKGAA
ncbi:MAG: CoA pyrophosphatase [Alphaproteobacteria bacterium]|nr:CoA pyrophosphatase [Alphaproteobacteria bacterium]